MNKRLAGLAAAAMVVGLAAVPSAKALSLTIDRVSGHFTGSGGEFTIAGTGFETYYNAAATAVNRYNVTGFESFCIEEPEAVSIPAVYDYTVGSGAIAGGYGGGNPDPVSAGTAWIYTQFAAGTLAGYNYTPGSGRNASAGLLQDCIWFLEQELTSIGGNTFYSAVLTHFGGSLAAARANDTVGSVKVLNLTQNVNGQVVQRQSQLVFTGPPTRVPDAAATVALLGLALTGIGFFGRKSR
jgi:hypothetical protein